MTSQPEILPSDVQRHAAVDDENSEPETSINTILQRAITNERSKKWKQVVLDYRNLLQQLNNLASSYTSCDRPAWMTTLLYESQYHLGVALQRLNSHRQAVAAFTRAIEAVFVYKGGCVDTNCHSNSCLMTPLFARRAFNNTVSGKLSAALQDAEEAVVLDTRNPDVYCIRALVRGSRGENKEALLDVEFALRLNARHLCALILHGQLHSKYGCRHATNSKPLMNESNAAGQTTDFTKPTLCVDHAKACSLEPACRHYLDVCSFLHPNIETFYDRFLYSLSVPHTICRVELDELPSRCSDNNNNNKRLVSFSTSTRRSCSVGLASRLTVDTASLDKQNVSRQSPNQFSSSNSSPSSVFWPGLSLRSAPPSPSNNGSPSSPELLTSPGSRSNESWRNPTTGRRCMSATSVSSASSFRAGMYDPKAGDQTRTEWLRSTVEMRKEYGERVRLLSARLPRESNGKRVAKTQTGITTSYQENEMPRMYYKPWLGDRLPVADVRRQQMNTYAPFKV